MNRRQAKKIVLGYMGCADTRDAKRNKGTLATAFAVRYRFKSRYKSDHAWSKP